MSDSTTVKPAPAKKPAAVTGQKTVVSAGPKKVAASATAPAKKPAPKPVQDTSIPADIVDDISYLDEFVNESKEEDRASRRGRRIYLRPSKDQKSRSTLIRPVFLKKNKFGQTRPIMFFAVHERLDQSIPGTPGERTLFPHMAPGVTRIPCIEPRANRLAKKIGFCPICRRHARLADFNKQLQAKSKNSRDVRVKGFAKSFGMWVNGTKASDNIGMVAIHVIPKSWENREKMLINMVEKDGKWVPATGDDRATKAVNPVGLLIDKRFYMQEVIAKITEKKMPKEAFEEENNCQMSDAEWQRKGPRLRTSPFGLKDGWAMSIAFSGKGLDTTVTVTPGQPTPMTAAQFGAVQSMYPNLMDEAKIPGTDIVPLEYGDWRQDHPDGTPADYTAYLQDLSQKISEILGIAKEKDGEGEVKMNFKKAIEMASKEIIDDGDGDVDEFGVGTDEVAAEEAVEEDEVPF